MKRVLVLSILSATFGACAQSILAPTPSAIGRIPLHHNIPATMAGSPEGPLYWLCATQLREYILSNGQHQLEEDYYL